MKTLLKIAVFSLISTSLFAQTPGYDQDALRLSMYSLNGNARFVSMGGAFGALGGNMNVLSTNPAGIGIYRSGEISFTPALTIGQTKTVTDEKKSRLGEMWNFNMGNFGWVGVVDLSSSESKDEWKKIQFGIGMNRLNDYWNRSGYSRYAPGDMSVLDDLTRFGDPEMQDLLYQGYLLNWDTIDERYYIGRLDTGGLYQAQTTVTKGAINEWTFSMGGNFGDYLYIGATVGRPLASFRQTRTMTETDKDNEHINFDEWRLSQDVDITGKGVNLKLGMIVKPADFVRIGLALHTPTRYKITEESTTTIRSRTYGDGTNDDKDTYMDSPKEMVSSFDYYIRTPMRLIGSLGFVIGKKALIGVEYEYLNYSRMSLDDMQNTFDGINEDIENLYANKGGTFKAGAEYRFEPFSLRVGYNYVLNPYNDDMMMDVWNSYVSTKAHFSQQTFTAGVGFYLGSMTLDLAYANTMRKYNDNPYYININERTSTGHQFLVTLGFRF